MTKGDQIENLLNEVSRVHKEMEGLFLKNNLDTLQLNMLPDQDYNEWVRLHNKSNDLFDQILTLMDN